MGSERSLPDHDRVRCRFGGVTQPSPCEPTGRRSGQVRQPHSRRASPLERPTAHRSGARALPITSWIEPWPPTRREQRPRSAVRGRARSPTRAAQPPCLHARSAVLAQRVVTSHASSQHSHPLGPDLSVVDQGCIIASAPRGSGLGMLAPCPPRVSSEASSIQPRGGVHRLRL